MLKILKVKFDDGNHTIDVSDDLEIVANLYADLAGTILLVRTSGEPIAPVESAAIIPEVVNPPEEAGLETAGA
jgi:hypothetical protein